MIDDAGMDRLLAASLSTEVPALSPAFDRRLMRRVRPRRLGAAGRAALAAYAVAGSVATGWAMWGLSPLLVVPGLLAVASAAVGVSAYARGLARG